MNRFFITKEVLYYHLGFTITNASIVTYGKIKGKGMLRVFYGIFYYDVARISTRFNK